MKNSHLLFAIFLCLINASNIYAIPKLKESASKINSEKNIESHSTAIHVNSIIISDDDGTGRLPLRDNPYGKIITYLDNDDEVLVINKQGNWYEVETSQGSGYIDKKWLKIDKYASGGSIEGVLENDTEVFDDEGEIIGNLSENSKVEIIGSDDDDYKIKFKDSYGYISKDVLDDDFDENDNNDKDDEPDDNNYIIDEENDETDDDDDSNAITLETDDEIDDDDDIVVFNNPHVYTKIIAKVIYPTKTKSTTSVEEEKDKKNTTTSSAKTTKDKTDSKDSNKNKSKSKKKTNKNKTELVLKTDNNLKKLLKNKDVKVSKKLTLKIGDTWDEKGLDFKNVQGFCTDGEYWYIALMTSTKYNGVKNYTKQTTKLLKIRIKDKKVVDKKSVGKIGHSNSLTYNSKTKKILSASCSKAMGCIYEFNASDLGGKKKIYLKDKKGKKMTKKCIASFSYDETNNQYIVKLSNTCLGYFDSDFKLKKKVTVKHLKINDNITGQAITCDGTNIFSVCNNLSVNPRINYIRIYDINGKYIKTLTFKKELGSANEKPEMEQITSYKSNYWSLTNVHGKFRIHKIKLR